MPKQVGAVALEGKGRPSIGPGVAFACPPRVKEEVEQLAEEMGIQRAEVIRRAFLAGWPAFRDNTYREVILSER